MATYKVLKPFQDGGIAYNPGDFAELDDNTATIHAEHGNIDLDSAQEIETITPEDVAEVSSVL